MLKTFHQSNLSLLKEESEILSPLLWHGALTRQQLAFVTQQSRTKVGQLLDGLLVSGWVEEVGQRDSVGGRKASLYGLNPHLGYYLGVDISGREVSVVLSDAALNVLQVHRESMDLRAGAGQVMARIKALICQMLSQQHISAEQLLSMAIGVPSPIEKNTGLMVSSLIMPQWDGFSIQDYCSRHFRVPVFVDNDTNLMALGELWNARRHGEGSQFESFMVLKLSSSIGAGMVINGQIYRGAFGGAGEIAHMPLDPEGPLCNCGQRGCLERMAGEQAILRQATEAGLAGRSSHFQAPLQQGQALTLADVARAAGEGDAEANAIIQAAGLKIGQVLAGLTNVLCPSHILIGGELAHIGPLMLAGIRQSVYGRAMPLAARKLTVDFTRLGNTSGLMGSLAHAMLCCFDLEAARS
ncbi:ROK family protein [Deinococcus roseus]|uniref:Transcriptional regulator n=1 Tax=Deinococcus roseus TaxID=392414 RepID=A0ABQ2CWJ1_9DEIO|nr:ROK family protein [Deinococcus roseus]GGJ28049.1 transcriptional regulator [Deinococcus roseus]